MEATRGRTADEGNESRLARVYRNQTSLKETMELHIERVSERYSGDK